MDRDAASREKHARAAEPRQEDHQAREIGGRQVAARGAAARAMPWNERVGVQMTAGEKVPLGPRQIDVEHPEKERERRQRQPHDEANQVKVDQLIVASSAPP